ncbi:MAG: hypothetical protein KAT61_09970 [Gammaproteobacteria bacterium]|nr:hypothetical protein [Gammaproteobacteria bacterium]
MYLEKPMIMALTMSVIFTVFNIIAVTSGSAENFYTQTEQFITNLIQ